MTCPAVPFPCLPAIPFRYLACTLVVCLLALIVVFRKNIWDGIEVRLLGVIKAQAYKNNKALYDLLDSMETIRITRTSIPESMRTRMHIINIPNFQDLSARQKCKSAMDGFCQEGSLGGKACRDDLVVFDVLQHTGAYIPSMHTDTEWNKLGNRGFQVWCLEYNHNADCVGNMFVFENSYLDRKYCDTAYYLRPRGDDILIVNNCKWANKVIDGSVDDRYILETMTKKDFAESTTKYYLDFDEGDCMLFESNVLHMSDYRDKSELRKSFNFRVAIKDENGDLLVDPDGCGYLHSVSGSVRNPSMYQLVE